MSEEEEVRGEGNPPHTREERKSESERESVICLRGRSARGPQGTESPRPAVMMVIDAGTIQTPQTLQQIKRLFCKVVKELNGEGERRAAHPLGPSALSHHQLLFSFLGVIRALREESYYKSFMLTRTGCTSDAVCVHTLVCECVEGG